jgi:hypothetical protein
MQRDKQVSSELPSDVEGFVTHLAKHFSLIFYKTGLVHRQDLKQQHTLMSSWAFASAISFLSPSMICCFRVAWSGKVCWCEFQYMHIYSPGAGAPRPLLKKSDMVARDKGLGRDEEIIQ